MIINAYVGGGRDFGRNTPGPSHSENPDQLSLRSEAFGQIAPRSTPSFQDVCSDTDTPVFKDDTPNAHLSGLFWGHGLAGPTTLRLIGLVLSQHNLGHHRHVRPKKLVHVFCGTHVLMLIFWPNTSDTVRTFGPCMEGLSGHDTAGTGKAGFGVAPERMLFVPGPNSRPPPT